VNVRFYSVFQVKAIVNDTYLSSAMLSRALIRAGLIAGVFAQTSNASSLPVDLGNFYVHLQPSAPPLEEGWFDKSAIKVAVPPLITGAAGTVGNGLPIDLVVLQRSVPSATARIGIFGYHQADAAGRYRPCRTFGTFAAIPQTVFVGQQVIDQTIWYYPSSDFCGESFGGTMPTTAILPTTDQITFGAPIRRTARDGGQYDASQMVVERNGLPWATYHWGYRLGMVASVSDWNAALPGTPANLATWPALPSSKDNFELVALGSSSTQCWRLTKLRSLPCLRGSAPARCSRAVATFRCAVFTAAKTVAQTLISIAPTTKNAQR
jgi:hypothetical protein